MLKGEWLSANEAARLLGISRTALRQRRSREGPTHPTYLKTAGSCVFYERSALERYRLTWKDGRKH